MNNYSLIDSGNGLKLERFGSFLIERPCSQAIWQPQMPRADWNKADALFTRENNAKWTHRNPNTRSAWSIEAAGIKFKIDPTDFGHLGIFPEQQDFWNWIRATIANAKAKGREKIEVLNLFAYSGGSTLAAAQGGAHVCHLDASKGMVAWARENALLNQLEQAPIRWMIDDVGKFLTRELRRGKRYDAIILDPPSFGRGSKGEVFKIEEHIIGILQQCKELLSDQPLFLLFSAHTPGFTPIVMRHLLQQVLEKGEIEEGEMLINGEGNAFSLPSGTYARWYCAP